MLSFASTSKLLMTIAEGSITLTNIFVQFPIAVAYKAFPASSLIPSRPLTYSSACK
jgi:hypothetical protein